MRALAVERGFGTVLPGPRAAVVASLVTQGLMRHLKRPILTGMAGSRRGDRAWPSLRGWCVTGRTARMSLYQSTHD